MRTLYGTESENCCGYCKLHRVSVTVKQMRTKQCLEKGCHYFRKKEEHPYWQWLSREEERKNERRQWRKNRKEQQNAYYESLQKEHPKK